MVDISSTLDPGIIELRVNIDRDKIVSYGISPTIVAQTISYYIESLDSIGFLGFLMK